MGIHVLVQIPLFLILLGTCLAKNGPTNFVFGDSLVDVGNNNYIVTLSKADYMPNGIDLGGPTGRFTNGRTIVDIIGEELGIEDYTPPYLAPTTVGPTILQGVNYASGGGGILNSTGKIFVTIFSKAPEVGRINFDAQIDNFANTRQDIISYVGASEALKLFEIALFSVTIGSNDFINNYLTPILSAGEQLSVSPEAFVDSMIARFRQQLTVNSLSREILATRLYDLGARRIVVANVGPIGCIPYERETNGATTDLCIDLPNQMARLYNDQLRRLISDLMSTLVGSKFVYADVYHAMGDILDNYSSYGFGNENSACCHVMGRFGGLVPCGPSSKICDDRSKFIFWDPYHPSDATNVIIAKRLMDGGLEDIWPMNVRQLMES